MKAAVITRFGKPDVLQIIDLPKPTIKSNEVLIKVKAVGVNPKDALIRKGGFRLLTGSKFPLQTGADFAGEIVEIGSKVQNFKVNDAVYGYLNSFVGRTVAEYVAVPEKWVGHKAKNLSFIEAAAIPCTYLTSLQTLRNLCKVQPNHRVCLYGASGGVGTAAIQLGKAFDAHITTISSTKNKAFCASLGADEALSYQEIDIFKTEKRFDVFYQIYVVGGNFYSKARKILFPKGRYVTTIPSPASFFQQFWTSLLPVPTAKVIIVNGNTKDLNYLTTLAEAGKIKPPIDGIFKLEEIQAAHRKIASKHTKGKIVIEL